MATITVTGEQRKVVDEGIRLGLVRNEREAAETGQMTGALSAKVILIRQMVGTAGGFTLLLPGFRFGHRPPVLRLGVWRVWGVGFASGDGWRGQKSGVLR